MNKKLLYMLFVLVLGGVFFCLFPRTIHAQGISPKEIVIRLIQDRAKTDAEAGKPREEVSGLAFLFGKEAEAAGMSNLEIVEIYEQAYKAAQVPPDPIKDRL